MVAPPSAIGDNRGGDRRAGSSDGSGEAGVASVILVYAEWKLGLNAADEVYTQTSSQGEVHRWMPIFMTIERGDL